MYLDNISKKELKNIGEDCGLDVKIKDKINKYSRLYYLLEFCIEYEPSMQYIKDDLDEITELRKIKCYKKYFNYLNKKRNKKVNDLMIFILSYYEYNNIYLFEKEFIKDCLINGDANTQELCINTLECWDNKDLINECKYIKIKNKDLQEELNSL